MQTQRVGCREAHCLAPGHFNGTEQDGMGQVAVVGQEWAVTRDPVCVLLATPLCAVMFLECEGAGSVCDMMSPPALR